RPDLAGRGSTRGTWALPSRPVSRIRDPLVRLLSSGSWRCAFFARPGFPYEADPVQWPCPARQRSFSRSRRNGTVLAARHSGMKSMKLSWSLLPVLVLAACERNEGSTEAKAPAASPANAAPAAANTEAPVAPPRNGAPEAQEKPGAAPAEGTTATEPAPPAKVAGKALAAEAEFQTVKGIELDGEARFEETPEGVRIVVEVEDAPPGKRGVHIHQFADCSDIAGQ